jgi:type II secretory pathway pseudopilin PulG
MSIDRQSRRLERDDRAGGDGGFTHVELMIALLVMGILKGIAGPTLLRAQTGAKDAAAKSQATQALKTQRQVLLTDGTYTSDPLALRKVEPSLDFRNFTDPDAAGEAKVLGAVYIRQANGTTVELATRSAAGECFWTRVEDGVTEKARGTCDLAEFESLDWAAGW